MSQKEAKIEKIRQWIKSSGAEDFEDPASMTDKELEQTLNELGLNKSADLGGGRRRSRRRRGGARRRRSRKARRSRKGGMSNWNRFTSTQGSPMGGRRSRKARGSRRGGARRSRRR